MRLLCELHVELWDSLVGPWSMLRFRALFLSLALESSHIALTRVSINLSSLWFILRDMGVTKCPTKTSVLTIHRMSLTAAHQELRRIRAHCNAPGLANDSTREAQAGGGNPSFTGSRIFAASSNSFLVASAVRIFPLFSLHMPLFLLFCVRAWQVHKTESRGWGQAVHLRSRRAAAIFKFRRVAGASKSRSGTPGPDAPDKPQEWGTEGDLSFGHVSHSA